MVFGQTTTATTAPLLPLANTMENCPDDAATIPQQPAAAVDGAFGTLVQPNKAKQKYLREIDSIQYRSYYQELTYP